MAGVATDVLSGWRRTRGGAGPTECVGPDGPDAGIVTIHERQRPALGLEGMVSLCLDRLRGEGTTDLVVHSPAPITTREGEYGAVVTITGVRSGLRVEHTLGVIDGDDFHTLVHARSSSAAHQAAVRAVARQIAIDLPLGLGALRYRRFRYDPPDDWEGREHGLLTKWTPHRESAEAPSEATIVVLPARPLYQSAAAAQMDNLLRDEVFNDLTVERRMATGPIEVAGFACLIVGVVGVIGESRRRCILTAALQDPRFLYVMRLQTDENHLPLHEPVFRNLVRSCKPLPAPAEADVLAVAHWAL